LHRQIPDTEIKVLDEPLQIRGVGADQHMAKETVRVTVYFNAVLGEDTVVVGLVTEAYVVDGLKANMLFGIDALGHNEVDLMLAAKKPYVVVCSCDNARIPLSIRSKDRVHYTTPKPVFAKERIVIPANEAVAIPIKVSKELHSDRDYIFTPNYKKVALTNHMVDKNFEWIIAKNYRSSEWVIPKGTRMGLVAEHEDTNVYSLDPTTATMAEGETEKHTDYSITHEDTDKKRVLGNGITVFDDGSGIADILAHELLKYDVWRDKGFADVPEDQWMSIPMKEEWEKIVDQSGKVYSASARDRKLIDEVHDKLHAQGRMSYVTSHAPTGFPVFVVWRWVDGPDGPIQKGRVVTDIRSGNKASVKDVYPMPRQEEIIAQLNGCKFITILDAIAMFFQWRVRKDHRCRICVVSHRGQECYNVAPMGYCNSPAYVQRFMDNLLREFREFCRIYIDDMIVSSMTLADHVEYLGRVLSKLENHNILLSLTKAYVGFPLVKLLGRRVNSLGLSTPEEKAAAIADTPFPKTLSALETWLGMVGYFRSTIPNFVKVVGPLEDRKTLLLKLAPVAGNPRKTFARKTAIVDPSPDELTAFATIRLHFKDLSFLYYLSPDRQTYIDLDACKNGFGAFAYHLKNDANEDQATGPGLTKLVKLPKGSTSRNDVQPILFLSCRTSEAEKRYWPTELEVACLVWVLKKLRHIIESAKKPVIIYTDHSATIAIAQQTTLNTTSVEKSNLRLVNAS
jgi:hypothetical protein